jgi:hypothetical protein
LLRTAVGHRVDAERAADAPAGAAEEGVPDVVGDVPGSGWGVVAAINGEEHSDDVVGALAVLGVTTDGGDVVGSWPERSVEYLPWPDRRRLGGR